MITFTVHTWCGVCAGGRVAFQKLAFICTCVDAPTEQCMVGGLGGWWIVIFLELAHMVDWRDDNVPGTGTSINNKYIYIY